METPLDVINSLWLAAGGKGHEFGEQAIFDAQLGDPEFYGRVPSLSPRGGVVAGSLYSYRGDQRLRTSKYQEEVIPTAGCVVDVDEDIMVSAALTFERIPLVCGPLPGLNPWASQYMSNASGSRKRTVEEMETLENEGVQVEEGCRCLVKLHDVDADEFRINDVLEFVGVCYPRRESLVAAPEDDMDVFDDFNPDASSLFSALPVLHSITFRRLCSSFPLLVSVRTDSLSAFAVNPPGGAHIFVPAAHLVPLDAPRRNECIRLRNILKESFRSVLRGDDVAAEYLLLALLSKVYSRKVGSAPLGFLSLNLSGFPLVASDALVAELVALVSEVVPLAVRVDASVDGDIVPRHDAHSGIFSVSSLQLAEGTVLCLDDRAAAGEAAARRECLASVVERLVLPLRSDYCVVDLPLDICAVVFSDKQSELSSLVHCPWQPESDPSLQPAEASKLFKRSAVDIRRWWATVRVSSVTMAHETIRVAENDFVNARQVDGRLTAEDFHAWLAVARLIAISYGDSEITPEHWQLMRACERKRLNRRLPRREGDSSFHYVPSAFDTTSPTTVAI